MWHGNCQSDGLGMQEEDKDVVELEEEMWDTIYGIGFWRTSSQRNKDFLFFVLV